MYTNSLCFSHFSRHIKMCFGYWLTQILAQCSSTSSETHVEWSECRFWFQSPSWLAKSQSSLGHLRLWWWYLISNTVHSVCEREKIWRIQFHLCTTFFFFLKKVKPTIFWADSERDFHIPVIRLWPQTTIYFMMALHSIPGMGNDQVSLQQKITRSYQEKK